MHLLQQYPNCQALFIFDNSTNHGGWADDALRAHLMNRFPGGKQPKMHRTEYKRGVVQSMVFEIGDELLVPWKNPRTEEKQVPGEILGKYDDLVGQPKGVEQVLRERGYTFATGVPKPYRCKASSGGCYKPGHCCMETMLSHEPDFRREKTRLHQSCISAGHKLLLLPKFHPELNPIEILWGACKRYTRAACDYSARGLRESVNVALEEFSRPEQIRKYFRRVRRFLDAYDKGLSDQEALWATRTYKSHRSIPCSFRKEEEE